MTAPTPPQGQPDLAPQHHDGLPIPASTPRKSWFARHKILTGIGAVVVVGIIGSAMGGGGDTPTTPAGAADAVVAEDAADDPGAAEAAADEAADEAAAERKAEEKAAAKAAAEKKAKEEATPGIGDAVRDGKFEFTVTEVETGVATVGDEYLNAEAQGQYVLVHMTVKNIGDEAQMFDGSSQELNDTKGRTHSADSTAAIYLGDADSFLTDINPGNDVDGVVVFDVPEDAVPASIVLHDSMFSGGVEVSLD